MDFRQLQTFLTVKDLKSFTKAAEQLGYAQSSITAQIQQLENELNVRLFERIGKSIALTDAGSRLVPYATEMLHLSRTMKAAVSDAGYPSGSITIGTSESLSISRLPAILSEYRRLYPDVEIILKLLSCSEFLPNLSRSTIDIAFTVGNRIETEQVAEIAVLTETIHVLGNLNHRLTQKSKLTEEDFNNETLLLTGPGCAYRGAFLNCLYKKHVLPKIALETDSVQVIKQAAMSGLGLCVLPAVSVTVEISAGKLVPLMFDTSDFNIISQLLVHKDKWRSPALQAFLEMSVRML